jgi:hypothetical protein
MKEATWIVEGQSLQSPESPKKGSWRVTCSFGLTALAFELNSEGFSRICVRLVGEC